MPSPDPLEIRPLQATMEWAAALPKHLRPYALLHAYPGIADRVALEWDDPACSLISLKELLLMRPGGRMELSPAVRRELLALRTFCAVRVRLTPPEWLEGRAR